MLIRTTVGAALAALLITTAAPAATITIKKDGCKPEGCYNINIEGKIEFEDAKKFESLVKANNIKLATVYLDSPGGNLIGGLVMGLSIHGHGFTTVVDYESRCVSVCASMWLAGTKRIVVSNANIGFHQPYFLDRRGRIHKNPQAVSLMKQYYAEIGVPKPAADFFLAADPREAYWLNADLAAGFGIEVTTVTAEEKPKLEERTTTLPKEFIEQLTSKKPL
jgi:hypothetical protein